MEKTYSLLIDHKLEIDLDLSTIESLDLIRNSVDSYHLLDGKKSYQAYLMSGNFNEKTYQIKINSQIFNIQIRSGLHKIIQEFGYSTHSDQSQQFIRAPMPGIIIDLPIKKGQQVKKGEVLLVLEAMKMENVILCPSDTTIKNILIVNGDTVQKNKPLIELDSSRKISSQ